MYGIDYRHTELRTYRDEARVLAARAAKEKAELLAEELGVEVGKPLEINENAQNGGYYAKAAFQNAVSYDSFAPTAGAETTLVGQIEVTASVYVRFSLE